MKRSLIILPVNQPVYPEWFYQPMPVTNSPGTKATHLAVLLLGEVPPHHGTQVDVLPTDTLKSALARVGFSRVLTGVIADRRVRVPAPVKPADAPAPSVWSRVKKLFGK